MTTLVRLSYRQQVICVTQKTHLRCFRKAPQALSRKKGNTVFRADRNGGMPLETNDLMLRLRVLSYSLTGAMQKAAQFYAQTPCSVSAKMSLRRAAQCIGVSESTVVRLAQQLGFDGFSPFRNALRESPAKIGAQTKNRRKKHESLGDLPSGGAGEHPRDRMRRWKHWMCGRWTTRRGGF